MTALDFINKWRYAINYRNLPAVGIHVGWELITQDSKVKTIRGKEAWSEIYSFTPPWFKTPQTFQKLIDTKSSDYKQIVVEETDNGKIEYYRSNGIQEPFFCAFSNQDGSFTILGDGNHRFFDCIYLDHEQGHHSGNNIGNTVLDILYLQNFRDVLRPDKIWPKWDNIW